MTRLQTTDHKFVLPLTKAVYSAQVNILPPQNCYKQLQ